ncbi:hypothetical protein STPYR_10189 [uncultured Stenotrophomonas sp.]|uniref:Uncharacterized protein n=1 Tax=uncultured Stenotrophomonas sp. TaxID=165438 RepID=A0A1Y5PZ39_9GAMM|nr:hypothetical protein STPYR_10189 [uncultured Stenotrophomonas sp.]
MPHVIEWHADKVRRSVQSLADSVAKTLLRPAL